MKKLYTLLSCVFLCFLFISEIKAQQDAQFIGYRQNGLVYNPAYAGSRDVGSLMAYYRAQWINVDNSTPRTFSVSLHGPMLFGKNPQFKNVGLGFWMQNDRVNIHNKTHINTSYAYKLNGVGNGTLSLGLQLGLLNISSKYSEITNADAGDILISEDVNKWAGNFGFGAFYYTDEYFFGVSIPHLLQNKLIPENENAIWNRHYYLTGGGVIDLSRSLKLRPSILLKKVANSPVSVDVNTSLLIEERFNIGLAYRFAESIDIFADYQVNRNLLIGYGFDFTTTKLASFGSSHDIYIRYEFGFMREKVVTPRFF